MNQCASWDECRNCGTPCGHCATSVPGRLRLLTQPLCQLKITLADHFKVDFRFSQRLLFTWRTTGVLLVCEELSGGLQEAERQSLLSCNEKKLRQSLMREQMIYFGIKSFIYQLNYKQNVIKTSNIKALDA